MNIIEKQSRLTFYNNKDTGFVDRQRKEVKYNEAESSLGTYSPYEEQRFVVSNNDQDENEPLNGTESDGKSSTKKEFSIIAAELRKSFYTFHQAIEKVTPYAEKVFNELKKNLSFKMPKILDYKALSEYFERQLFKLAKNPKQVRKNWSEEETCLLISIIAYYSLLHGEDYNSLDDQAWKYISNVYPGKKHEHLRARWQSIYKLTLNKAPWNAIEDDVLLEIIKEQGPHHWKEIALELSHRCELGIFRQGKQCRERWINHLDPNVKKGIWTEEEDLALLKYFTEKGKKWAEIAKRLGGRTENNVKNRWISLMRKYKSELNIDSNEIENENEEDVAWEKKIAVTILASKDSSNNYSSLINNHNTIDPLPKEENDDNINLDPVRKISSSSQVENTLSKSLNEAGAIFNKAPSKKKTATQPKKNLNQTDLSPNLEKREFLKSKPVKYSSRVQKELNTANNIKLEFQTDLSMTVAPKQADAFDYITEKVKAMQPITQQLYNQHNQISFPAFNHLSMHDQASLYQQQLTARMMYGQQNDPRYLDPNMLFSRNLAGLDAFPPIYDSKFIQTPQKQGREEEPQQLNAIAGFDQIAKPYDQDMYGNSADPSPMSQFRLPPIDNRFNNEDQSKVFKLVERRADNVLLDPFQRLNRDSLYFAMVDIKSNEIFLMSQVTSGNLSHAMNPMNLQEKTGESKREEIWPQEVNEEADLSDLTYLRKNNEFPFFND